MFSITTYGLFVRKLKPVLMAPVDAGFGGALLPAADDGATSWCAWAFRRSAWTKRGFPRRVEGGSVDPGQRRRYRACGNLVVLRVPRGEDGGGTIGPMSPSGASSRSTITGA
jgi:hypothetical protein